MRKPLCAALATLALHPVADALPLADRLARLADDADPKVLQLAARALECAERHGEIDSVERLAVIDYSRPSTEPRLWVFDLSKHTLVFREHVAHGRGSGANLAERFSNIEGSHQTSLGLFRTAETYIGGNGYSLRMDGLEPGINDRARQRAIVMHGADYVDPTIAERQGRLGRSFGCPAVRRGIAKPMIDSLAGGQLLFAYYPDPDWLSTSPFLACESPAPGNGVAAAP